MTRFAYLILAHEGREQLAALINRLCPPGSDDIVVLHIDAASPLARDAGALAAANRAVKLVTDPVRVHWGHLSQIEAIRRLLRTALACEWDVAHLISGADWPVAPREQLAAEAGSRCWIEAMANVQSDRMTYVRLDSRWLRADPARPLAWHGARLLKRLSMSLPERASAPWGPWHKGAQWWSLPRDACAAVHTELDRGFAARRFHFTACVDEHAIPTIVAHHFADRLAPGPQPHRRYIDWGAGGSSPAWLTAADWPAAQASGAWFARKFSISAAQWSAAPFKDASINTPSGSALPCGCGGPPESSPAAGW